MNSIIKFHPIYFAVLFVAATTLLACNPDNVSGEPEIEAPLVALNYDRANDTAPVLPANTYEAAAKFTTSELAGLEGGNLVDVYYYFAALPSSTSIKIYKGTKDDAPDSLVYSAAVTSESSSNTWNKHTLTAPVSIGTSDIWIAVKFTHTGSIQSMGCDPGPGNQNGDWLFDSSDNEWLPLRQRTSEININWNIRGVVDPG